MCLNLAKWFKTISKKKLKLKKIIRGFQVYIMSKYSSPEEIKKAKQFNKALVGLIIHQMQQL